MADFVQTMKDWRRMCIAMKKERPNDACCGCRLEGYGCAAIYEDNSHVDFADVEKNVVAWAAEHPEPVYPTWGEYLHTLHNEPSSRELSKPIPADIAQRLGIEPKEE